MLPVIHLAEGEPGRAAVLRVSHVPYQGSSRTGLFIKMGVPEPLLKCIDLEAAKHRGKSRILNWTMTPPESRIGPSSRIPAMEKLGSGTNIEKDRT